MLVALFQEKKKKGQNPPGLLFHAYQAAPIARIAVVWKKLVVDVFFQHFTVLAFCFFMVRFFGNGHMGITCFAVNWRKPI